MPKEILFQATIGEKKYSLIPESPNNLCDRCAFYRFGQGCGITSVEGEPKGELKFKQCITLNDGNAIWIQYSLA